MKKILTLLIFVILLGCTTDVQNTTENQESNYQGKKILLVNSYHQGYQWSDGIESAVQNSIKEKGIELKIFRMDSKRNSDEGFIKNKALEAKTLIEEYNPDVIITADDNAFKYLIMPYYKNTKQPVVFCGVNWDASVYDAPYVNTAGMIEVALISKIAQHMSSYASGSKIGFLTGDVLSEHKNAEHWANEFDNGFHKVVYVKNFEEWKTEYKSLQKEVDMLFIGSSASIENWDMNQAKSFVLENSKIPSGAELEDMMPISLLGLTKIAEEQGEWSAQTALSIMDGANPYDIPVVKNKKGNLMLNLQLAEKLGIVFSPDMIKNAKIIE